MTRAHTPADLSALERTYLGALATGIVPARLAQDDSLRMDYLTAVCLAIVEGRPRNTYLAGDGPQIGAEFRQMLTGAVLSLDEKGIIAAGPPASEMVLTIDPAIVRPRPPKEIDFDQHPRIIDRFLAHACMEQLFGNPDVYPFLIGKYQDSADVWGRLYQRGDRRR